MMLSLLLGSLDLHAVASISDVRQGTGTIVRIVTAIIEMFALQKDLFTLVHC